MSGLVALITNAGLCYWLIPQLGIVGAAMSTAIAYASAVVVLVIVFLRESGLTLTQLFLPNRSDFEYFRTVIKKLARRVPGSASILPASW